MQSLDEESYLDSEMSEGQRNGVVNVKQQQHIVKGGSQGIMNFKGNTQVSSQNPSQRLDTEEVFDMQLDLEDLEEIEKPQQQQQKIEVEHFQNNIQDEKNVSTQSNTKATGIKLEEKNLTTFKDTDDYFVLFNSSDKTNLQQKNQPALAQNIFQQSNETPKLKSQAGQEMKQQTKNAQSPKRKKMTPLEKVFADFKKNQSQDKYNQSKSKFKEIKSTLDSKAPLPPNRDIKNMQHSKTSKIQTNKQKNNQVVLKS